MTKTIYDSEINYPKGTPFTYIIGWSELDVHYYGVRFARNCHPDDLWTKYFSSSKVVKKFRQENGEPDIIKVRQVFESSELARKWEEKVLRRMKVVHSDNWLNRCCAAKEFYFKEHTEESKRKLSEINRGKKRSEESKIKNGNSHKGKKRSDETRQKMSDSKKGRIYINNGIEQKIVKIEKAESVYFHSGWFEGKLEKCEFTENHKQKIGKANKGRIYINNGIINKSIKPEFLKEYLDIGWFSGRIKKTPIHLIQ